MSNETNVSEKNGDNKKALRICLTIVSFLLLAAVLLTVFPVVCPLIFGMHTYNVGTDTTGQVSQKGSIVYVKSIDESEYTAGNVIAVAIEGSKAVDVYCVGSNDTGSGKLILRNGESTNYGSVVGKIVAKTPFVGYLTQLCYSPAGVIITSIIFIAGVALIVIVDSLSKKTEK